MNGNNSQQLVTSELQVPKTASHGTVEGETSLLLGHISGGVGLTCCVTDAVDNTAHGCCYCEMLTKVPNFWNHRRKKQEENRRGGSGEGGRECSSLQSLPSVSLIPVGITGAVVPASRDQLRY